MVADKDRHEESLKSLACRLQLPLTEAEKPSEVTMFDTVLFMTETHRLALQQTGRGAMGPICVDFCAGAARHRRIYGGGKGQAIARAIGLQQVAADEVSVVDATAGLGADSFVLASLGCHVIMIERSEIVHALLLDGLTSAGQESVLSEITNRMQLVLADSVSWFRQQLDAAHTYDVVYLDPMFPAKKKQAAVKKEMQILQRLLDHILDEKSLLEMAMAVCRHRVVVKRPLHAPPLAGVPPDFSLKGKSVRFDCFVKASFSKR